MIHKNYFLTFAAMLLVVVACEDPYNSDLDPSKADYINNDNPNEPSELDIWLENNFRETYNIEVKYRWDASEGDIFRTLVPPATDKVQEVMDAVKKVWIDPYVALAGEPFIKTYCPKQFLLIGSPSYNPGGTITLGQAEGGRKVVLFVVNDFVKTDPYAVKQMIHTVEHEFAHILHQNIAYPSEFKEITAGGYSADWHTIPLNTARSKGFITSYAMASPDEDFVEMVAMMLVEGKESYEKLVDCAGIAAADVLRQKEKLVVQYFKEAYDINFYALQEEVQKAIQSMAPSEDEGESLPPVADIWGFGKEYTSLRFDLDLLNFPVGFVNLYASDHAALQRGGFGLENYFRLYYSPDDLEGDILRLQFYYYNYSDVERVFYKAEFMYWLTTDETGLTQFTLIDGDDNAIFLANDLGMHSLIDYFSDSFRIDWDQSCSGDGYHVGLFPQNPNKDYCFGILGN